MDKCSFCGRDKRDTNLLIAGISGHICDNCVEQAYEIVKEETKKSSQFDINSIKLLKPKEIKKFLDLICDRAGRRQKNNFRFCLQSL